MSTFRPLFVTSTARSGSYLISMMMSANKDVTVASEPFLELFRSMRNAFVRNHAPADLARRFDPSSPMQDYYFEDERIALMDVIQAASVETPFDPAEWDQFLRVAAPRTGLQCAELLPYMDSLRGRSYKDMFDRAFQIIAQARHADDRKWVGIKDAWTIEFFAPLARAYPDARFVAILRDPRAIVASMLGIERIDPLQVAQVLSYTRHWRKLVAFILRFRQNPLLAGRLHVLTHDAFVREPEPVARNLCNFLGVDFDPVMLDTSQYLDYATGAPWSGNSSFEDVTQGISVHRSERWRTVLDRRVVKLVEFVCEQEMRLFGFEPVTRDEDRWPDAEILEYILEKNEAAVNWRTDLRDPQRDYGYELFRRALVTTTQSDINDSIVRRSFLFREAFDALRAQASSRAVHGGVPVG